MSVLPKLELHDFVLLDNGLGVGQVTSIDSGVAEVSYFESTANPRADTAAAHVDVLRAVALQKKQRCFVHADGCWWAGRVEDREGRRYLVRFRGGERWIDGCDLRVRWNRALADPLDDLIGVNWWAHPVEVALRREFLERCGRQRRQVLGLSGLSSLVAEVHAHQIEVARRVLEDPVGRFLLADEVGLGKTIEALFIIRQFLLDDPESRIRVIAPAALCSQWREELGRRAFVTVDGGDFPYAQVEVLSMGDAQSWSGSTVVDLLVIDEAHRVAAWAHSPSDGARRSYAAAQELTGRVASVILISATPSLHSSGTFLALLHLLDPQRHDLDDLEGFEAMLARRDEVASALLALDTGDPVEILVDSLSDLARTIPAEAELRQEIMTLAKELEVTTEADEGVRSRLERLKLEVAESFRVDRRMLRTRRRAVERRFPVRGRHPGSELRIESSGFEEADAWFERWRTALLVDHQTSAIDIASRHRTADLVALFADRVMGAPGLLAPLCRARLGEASDADFRLLDLGPPELATLTAAALPPGREEGGELGRVPLIAGAVPPDYIKAITEHLWDEPSSARILVMTSFSSVAVELEQSLRALFREGEVASHRRGADSQANKSAVAGFVSDHDSCHILICDLSAEEGLNLQCADVLLLPDLPLAADRLEQRIGRADRFSYRDPVRVEIIQTIGRTDLRDAWVEALTNGFGVFDRSIAAFQVSVGELLPVLRERLLTDGPRGLQASTALVAAELSAAERELTRSELLDAIWVDQAGEEIVEGIAETDRDWEAWRGVADRLIAKSLRLIRWFHSDDIVSFWLQNSRVSHIEPEIDAQGRADYFLDVVSHGGLTKRSTYERATAVENQNVRLLRVGDQFIDEVERYLRERHDDGRVAAIWRKTHRLPDGIPQIGFVFHFSSQLALPDGAASLPAREQAILQRRALAAVPPGTSTVRVSADGAVLGEDDDLGLLLSFDYDPRRGDSLLTPPAFSHVRTLLAEDWEQVSRRAAEAARAVARQELGLEPRDRLISDARRSSDGRVGILEGREASTRMLDGEAVLMRLLEHTLATADVRLEAIELIVVSDADAPASPRPPGVKSTA